MASLAFNVDLTIFHLITDQGAFDPNHYEEVRKRDFK
jgi:hypothetical protein